MGHQTNSNSSFGLYIIGAILLSIIFVFITVKMLRNNETVNHEEDLIAMQKNAQYALNLLAASVRNAGYLGCNKLTKITPHITFATPSIAPYTFDTVFTGYQSVGAQRWQPRLPKNVFNVTNDTDVMTVKTTGACATALSKDMKDLTSRVAIDPSNICQFSPGDIVLISDCKKADLFRITKISEDTGLLSHTNFSDKYTADIAQLLSYSSTTYFISNDPESQKPALYSIDNTKRISIKNPTRIMPGVENMQVQYGVDINNDGKPERYYHANEVKDWEVITLARITLLMHSIIDVDAPDYTFNVAGMKKTYSDGVLRQEFTTTVRLHNR